MVVVVDVEVVLVDVEVVVGAVVVVVRSAVVVVLRSVVVGCSVVDVLVDVVVVVLDAGVELLLARAMASTTMTATRATPTMITGTNQPGRPGCWPDSATAASYPPAGVADGSAGAAAGVVAGIWVVGSSGVSLMARG